MSEQHSIRPNSFVGRARELALLDAGLADALAGHGRLVLLGGEPGIGKTRLAEENSRHAEELGFNVAWGRCWQEVGAPPYWPLTQIIRALLESNKFASAIASTPTEKLAQIASLVPEVYPQGNSAVQGGSRSSDSGEARDPEARFKLFDSVTALLRRCAKRLPLVLIIDDLHDADQSSLQMLSFIVRGLAGSRVTLLGTYRDAEVRRSPELSKHIAELHREGGTLLLAGLNQTEVDEFVESRAGRKADPGLIKQLHTATDGNPLFVDGVVRLMLAEGELSSGQTAGERFRIPDGVRGSIHRQLSSLPEETNSLLDIAAVIGNEFESALLQAVGGRNGEDLAGQIEPAIVGGIVIGPRAGSFRFAHALIRDSLYGEIKPARRIELHTKVGAAIENLHRDHLEPLVAKLSHHFAEAGLLEKAVDYSIRAGDAAYTVFAYEEAALHWRFGLTMVPNGSTQPKRRSKLLCRLGDVLVSSESQAIEYLEAAIPLVEGAGRTLLLAGIHVHLGFHFASGGGREQNVEQNLRRSKEHFDRAELLLDPNDESYTSIQFHIGQADRCIYTMETSEGLKHSRRAMEICDRLGRGFDWARAAIFHSRFLLQSGSLSDCFSLQEKARASAAGSDNTIIGSTVAMRGANNCSDLWDPREALKWYLTELAEPRTSRSTVQSSILSWLAADMHSQLGELDDARKLYIRAGLRPDEELAKRYGEWDRCITGLVERLQGARRTGVSDATARLTSWVGELKRALGYHQESEALLLESLTISLKGPHLAQAVFTAQELCLLYADMGRTEDARKMADLCRKTVAHEDWRGLAGGVLRGEATVAALEGKIRESDLLFEQSIEVIRRYSFVWKEAETFHNWGRALAAAGEFARAHEKFDAAIGVYRRIGAGQPWIDLVEQSRAKKICAPRAPGSAHSASMILDSPGSVFRKEGEFWTISYESRTFRLKDAKGLHYIAHLLSHPGEKFRVHDLVAVVEGPPERAKASARALPTLEVSGDLGDLGPILDDKAKASYRRRRQELREELDEAEAMNDESRAERARAEIEMLEQQLRAAVGLGGRDRKTSAHAERARVVVTQNIRAVLGKIAEQHAPLGRHLNSAIKTGYLCAYLTEPERTVAWRL